MPALYPMLARSSSSWASSSGVVSERLAPMNGGERVRGEGPNQPIRPGKLARGFRLTSSFVLTMPPSKPYPEGVPRP